MSLSIIRRALELRLDAMAQNIATAAENVSYSPVIGTPYQRLNLLPSQPDGSVVGSGLYFERGIFQITLCYPLGVGPADAETQAQRLRLHFKRGTTMTNSGITVLVMEPPRVSPSLVDGEWFCIAVSIPFQAQIAT